MPIYAYRCKKCDEKFEEFRNIRDTDNDVECPVCGEKRPQRILSPFFSKNAGKSGGSPVFPT